MKTASDKKPRLTPSAMIASIASEGQRVQAAPFGKALVEYAADHPERIAELPGFLARRAAAYQAYFEMMPLRRSAQPTGPDMLLYRSLGYGRRRVSKRNI